jgi:hypothetical protein
MAKEEEKRKNESWEKQFFEILWSFNLGTPLAAIMWKINGKFLISIRNYFPKVLDTV